MRAALLLLVVALAGSALLNLALVALGRGSFGQGLLVILLVYIAATAAILGIVAIARPRVIGSGARWIGRSAIAFAFVLASTLVSLPLGGRVHDRDVAEAKAYCEALVPRLEAYRRQHGAYPSTIELLGDLPRTPLLLQRYPYYRYSIAQDSTYYFTFSDPAEMMGSHGYSSQSGTWARFD